MIQRKFQISSKILPLVLIVGFFLFFPIYPTAVFAKDSAREQIIDAALAKAAQESGGSVQRSADPWLGDAELTQNQDGVVTVETGVVEVRAARRANTPRTPTESPASGKPREVAVEEMGSSAWDYDLPARGEEDPDEIAARVTDPLGESTFPERLGWQKMAPDDNFLSFEFD